MADKALEEIPSHHWKNQTRKAEAVASLIERSSRWRDLKEKFLLQMSKANVALLSHIGKLLSHEM